jgi:hypothetical protein
MARYFVGYEKIIRTFGLPARPHRITSRIDTSAKSRSSEQEKDRTIQIFDPRYDKGDKLESQLAFAFRYEGINLEILAFLFRKTGEEEITAWLKREPRGKYARMAGFLYEFLTGKNLHVSDTPPVQSVKILDPEKYVTGTPVKNRRFHVENNLLGAPEFCPVIRLNQTTARAPEGRLKSELHELMKRVDSRLLERAAGYLYTKETRSSFKIEGERPTVERVSRFVSLLFRSQNVDQITEEWLTQIQNAIVEPRFSAKGIRKEQNWIGGSIGYHEYVDFVPPSPEDLPSLMSGWMAFSNRILRGGTLDFVVAKAAAASFGFVFLHPFMDGNGRIHRFLIHQMLSVNGLTPDGFVLPVSAVILSKKSDYLSTLEAFSRPLKAFVSFDPGNPSIPAEGNDPIYYRYFDATPQSNFLETAVRESVEKDLPREIDFLVKRDKVRERLDRTFDWKNDGSLDFMINLLVQNDGHLSKAKKEKFFSDLHPETVEEIEKIFADVFSGAKISPEEAIEDFDGSIGTKDGSPEIFRKRDFDLKP